MIPNPAIAAPIPNPGLTVVRGVVVVDTGAGALAVKSVSVAGADAVP